MSREIFLTKTEVIRLDQRNISDCLEIDRLSLKGFWNKSQWEFELDSPFRLCIGIQSHSKILALACSSIGVDQLDITLIAVHPNFQRKGLGIKVLSSLAVKSKEINISKLILEVRRDNIPAIELYKKFSFKQISIRKQYYRDGCDAMVLAANI